MMASVAVPIEALATLRRRLDALPGRHPQREILLSSTAELYAVSRATLYRLLRGERVPPERVYFRTAPRFETAAPGFEWLNRSLFLGFAERDPEAVRVRIYSV